MTIVSWAGNRISETGFDSTGFVAFDHRKRLLYFGKYINSLYSIETRSVDSPYTTLSDYNPSGAGSNLWGGTFSTKFNVLILYTGNNWYKYTQNADGTITSASSPITLGTRTIDGASISGVIGVGSDYDNFYIYMTNTIYKVDQQSFLNNSSVNSLQTIATTGITNGSYPVSIGVTGDKIIIPTKLAVSGNTTYQVYRKSDGVFLGSEAPPQGGEVTGISFSHDGKFGAYSSMYTDHLVVNDMTETPSVNTAPNEPQNLVPAGTSSTLTTIRTLTPTLSWTFSDPDTGYFYGNMQSSFQVQIYTIGGSLAYDSQQVTSTSSSYTVPASAGLQPNTVYYWTVRTWDNFSTPMVGPYATNQYFKTSQAPTTANLTPGSTNSTTPSGSSVTPRFSWTYSDAEGDVQTSYQVKVYNPSTSLLVYDSQKVTSATTYHDVPAGVLGAGIKFYWNVTVWDSTGMSSTSASEYILTNNPPAPVTLVSPTDNYRVNLRPVFLANIGDDVENDKQNFKIQLADDAAFTVNLKEYSTATSITGWESNNGISWVALPSGGTDSTFEGKQVRYTMQSDLTEGKTYYWRMAPIDGTTNTVGSWSSTRRIRVGTMLQFKLKTPLTTSAAAKKIVLVGKPKIPSDGTTPATLKVEVCNNGLDTTPTWEDATATFTSGAYYVFINTTKTNANWAVDCRVTVTANDSLGAIEFDGIGLSFS